VGLNKIDRITPDKLRPDAKKLLENIGGDNVTILPMSTLTEEGVSQVKEFVSIIISFVSVYLIFVKRPVKSSSI